MNNINIRFYLFVLFITVLFGVCFTSADFITIPASSTKDIFILLLQWFTVIAAIFPLLLLLATNKYVFAVCYPLLTLISSILTYFRFTMNAVFTPMILDATLQNDVRTSAELCTPELFLFVFITFIISIVIVYYRIKKVTVSHYPYLIGIGFLLLFTFTQIDKLKRPISERIPFNIYYTFIKYWEEKQIISQERRDLSAGIKCSDNELTVVFVLGESLRPDHLELNGYERNTNPLLSKEDVISFPNVYTEQTYTNRSIPHILTRADSMNYDCAYQEKSFIHLFNACDYYTVWLGNQEAADTYVYFMNECDSLYHVNIDKSSYVFDRWVDGDLLPLYSNALQSSAKKKLILLHTIGSHWWYNSHFTDEYAKYTPLATSKIISSNTKEEMINSYDNTVLYTDYFLHALIDQLRDKKAILIYQSDHGEALGEDGVWLHAAETEYTHKAASIVWMSPSYKEAYPDFYNNAKENRLKKIRTDYLFHSILDAGGIDSDYKLNSFSIFRKAD